MLRLAAMLAMRPGCDTKLIKVFWFFFSKKNPSYFLHYRSPISGYLLPE
jgi:hypothetical protein